MRRKKGKQQKGHPHIRFKGKGLVRTNCEKGVLFKKPGGSIGIITHAVETSEGVVVEYMPTVTIRV